MRLRYYLLLALLALGLVGGLAYLAGAPVAPFVVVIAFGEMLLAFQMEHHKLGRFLKVMRREMTIEHPGRIRHVH